MQYINLLRKCKMKARLALARQSMHSRFPLAEPLWLEWLDDETAACTTEERSKKTEQLFGLAVQDYLSVPLWAKYIQ